MTRPGARRIASRRPATRWRSADRWPADRWRTDRSAEWWRADRRLFHPRRRGLPRPWWRHRRGRPHRLDCLLVGQGCWTSPRWDFAGRRRTLTVAWVRLALRRARRLTLRASWLLSLRPPRSLRATVRLDLRTSRRLPLWTPRRLTLRCAGWLSLRTARTTRRVLALWTRAVLTRVLRAGLLRATARRWSGGTLWMSGRRLRVPLRRLSLRRTLMRPAWVSPAWILPGVLRWWALRWRSLSPAAALRWDRGATSSGRCGRRGGLLVLLVTLVDLLPRHCRDGGPGRCGRAVTLVVVAAHGHLPNKEI